MEIPKKKDKGSEPAGPESYKENPLYPGFLAIAKMQLTLGKAIEDAGKSLGIVHAPKHRLVEQREDGRFFYNGKPVEFTGSDTLYEKLFAAIFGCSSGNGLASYDAIDKQLRNLGLPKVDDLVKRIRNGIPSILRYSNLPKLTPTKRKIIEVIRGKGVMLNNPEVGS